MEALPTIGEVEASAYTVPTEGPEADGTLAWKSVTLVLVQVSAEGQVGTGWTYGSMGIAALIRQTLAPMLVGRSVVDNAALWSEMAIALRDLGRPGIGAMALSAVDCALWDLKARCLGLPLHDLLGAVRPSVPIYGSGGFTTYDERQLAQALQGWVGNEGLRRVKIKIGEAWGDDERRDLDRVRQARKLVGPDVELFVGANGGYPVGQAARVAADLDEFDVRWFEEPVSSDDLPGLRHVRQRTRADVAAGAYGYDLDYFRRLCVADAVDCVQVDVTRCGGITELLRIAAITAAHNLDVSAHGAPYQHLSAMAAVPNARHLEWFHDHVRIERWFFDGGPGPENGSLAPSGHDSGHGLVWQQEAASRFRVF